MAAPMEHLYLLDGEENKEYVIAINKADAEKARNDINFATMLLQEAKKQHCDMECRNTSVTDHASTSEGNICESTGGMHVWSKEETLLLINIYSKYKDKFNSGKGTVKQFWNKIAQIMQEQGYEVSRLKCSTKFQALKRTYKSVIDHNKKSGNNRKEWEFFNNMEELFADKPWVQPLTVAGSHLEDHEENGEKENTQERCTKKRKLNVLMEEYILNCEERKKRREMREKQHEEKINSLKRIENLMEKLLEERR